MVRSLAILVAHQFYEKLQRIWRENAANYIFFDFDTCDVYEFYDFDAFNIFPNLLRSHFRLENNFIPFYVSYPNITLFYFISRGGPVGTRTRPVGDPWGTRRGPDITLFYFTSLSIFPPCPASCPVEPLWIGVRRCRGAFKYIMFFFLSLIHI